MPKLLIGKNPSYRRHKASGQAVVTIGGKDYYLGPWGTAASKRAYDRVIAEWRAGGQKEEGVTVGELLVAYIRYAKTYYVKRGRVTNEVSCVLCVAKYLKQLYLDLDANDFGPIQLKALREKFIDADWSRGFINRNIQRAIRIWRWGVAEAMIRPDVLVALQAVTGLKAGRTRAREGTPRTPVPQENIEKVKERCRRQRTRDLIDLQLLTGCRPSELLNLHQEDIDTTGEVWTATIGDHKTAHLGKERKLYFGPQAKLILARYINKWPHPKGLFRGYTLKAYRATMKKMCTLAGVPRFTPYSLRHTAATRIREQLGIEAAQVVLGHAQLSVTELYAKKSEKLARETALKMG